MPTFAMFLAQRQRLQGWIWKSMVAGLCGIIAHTVLISIKVHVGWLPSFQPYQALQRTLSQLVGSNVSPIIPWAISYLNGMTVVGLLFGSGYRLLPGRHGITKGLSVGVLVWLIMGSVFFPLVGLGFFAFDVGLGFQPTLFSLTMVETYSAVMGAVFALLNRETTIDRAAGRTTGLKVKNRKHPEPVKNTWAARRTKTAGNARRA